MTRPQAAVLPPSALEVDGGQTYLHNLPEVVRSQFAGATGLKSFVATDAGLTISEKKCIVEQALILIEQNYAHLPLKRAMHSIDPVQRLRLLLRSLDQQQDDKRVPETMFHREMTDIFTSLRDLHTNYLLPAPYSGMTAFLPFMVEDYFEGDEVRYVVTKVAAGFTHQTFVPGVEITYWNGTPINKAVWNQAQRFAGSNLEARHARGVQTLTTRALLVAPPPDEEWVIVGYRAPDGTEHETRFDWLVAPVPPAAAGAESAESPMALAALGLDVEQEAVHNVRTALFRPDVLEAEQRAFAKAERGESFGDLETALPKVFKACPVSTPSGTFGYIRIRTFDVWPVEDFVDEFVRLISGLPQNGLIIDVRANGGGIIMNGEEILQTLTPCRIEPEPVQFVNTTLNLRLCERHGSDSQWANLSPFVDSMQQALQTGSTFSAGFPISDPERCNAIGQKYFGPVVLIIDALCYSTTDIFASGFQDHRIGKVLGTDGNTGAGGANVWTHDALLHFVFPEPDTVYKPLPKSAGMRVSVRRTLRVGKRAGTPVEDLGVVPDERHFLTKRDVLEGNVDLIAKAGAMLAAEPKRSLNVTSKRAGSGKTALNAECEGMNRLDLYIDDRPVQSADVTAGRVRFTVARAAPVEIRGYSGKELVARYRTIV